MRKENTNTAPLSLSFTLVWSRLLSFALIYFHLLSFGVGDDLHEAFVQIRAKYIQNANAQGEQQSAAPPLRSHLLSFAIFCSHLLSFAIICSRLGVGTNCMRRSFKHERHIFKKLMSKENSNKLPFPSLWLALVCSRLLSLALACSTLLSFAKRSRPLASLSFTVVCSRLLSLALICFHLLSFGIGDDLHEAFLQIQSKSFQTNSPKGNNKTRPLPPLSFTLVRCCFLSLAIIYYHLLSFGGWKSAWGVCSNTNPKKEWEKNTRQMRPLPSLALILVCSRLLSLAFIYYNLHSFWNWGRSAWGVRSNTTEIFSKRQCARRTKKTRPLSSLSYTLVGFCLLSRALISFHLLSFGVGDDLHEAIVQIRTVSSPKNDAQGKANKHATAPLAFIYARLLSFAPTWSNLL